MPKADKPLGRKAYGSIPHLPNSRRGPGDHGVNDGQARMCCEKSADPRDTVIVQEKLDGSCVSVAQIDGAIVPLIRAGYRAEDSRYRQHHMFAAWTYERQAMFDYLLDEGERIVGEWLAQAHGTRYDLRGDPFVAFDIMSEAQRVPYDEFQCRIGTELEIPPLLHRGSPLSTERVMELAGKFGRFGAIDPIEGVVYRVERQAKNKSAEVLFLAKWVRADKVDGHYLPEISGQSPVWNWLPNKSGG